MTRVLLRRLIVKQKISIKLLFIQFVILSFMILRLYISASSGEDILHDYVEILNSPPADDVSL
jgi:hypothetical protein